MCCKFNLLKSNEYILVEDAYGHVQRAAMLCSVLVEDNCDKIRNGEWKERPYAWNPVS
jgi:hypothetical protein